MPVTLDDTIQEAVKKGFYITEKKGEYIKFVSFGSLGGTATTYDGDGNILRKNEMLYIDGKEIRERYKLVPIKDLPPALRAKESPLVQQTASTQRERVTDSTFPDLSSYPLEDLGHGGTGARKSK